MTIKKISILFIIAVFSIVLLFDSNVSANTGKQFADLPPSLEGAAEINYLVKLGVINGYPGNVFKPEISVTKGQAAKMVVIAGGYKSLSVSKPSFSDLKSRPELSGYIERAVSLGFFNKITNGKFMPDAPLTRGEMSKVLATALKLDVNKYASIASPFSDISKNSPYHKYINALYYNGITVGSNGKFNPSDVLTRKHFSMFVARSKNDSFRLDVKVADVNVPNQKEIIGKVASTTDFLNVRSSKSTTDKSNIVGQVNNGHVFDAYAIEDNWIKVSYNNQYGYVSAQYTKFVDPNDSQQIPGKEQITTKLIGRATVNNLKIRSSASPASTSIGVLNRGDEVSVISVDGFWAKIQYEGNEAFVHKTYLKLINKAGSSVAGRIIVLDPGHGGKDPGAMNGSYNEKRIALSVANVVKRKLENDGAIVYMTREGDSFPTLQQRVDFAHNHFAEVFVSIHVNSASNTSANGTETYYSISANDNEKEDFSLASNINSQIINNADMYNRGVKREDWYVVRYSRFPSVLVELGFISNSNDLSKLVSSEYTEIFGDSIYKGIVNYYKN